MKSPDMYADVGAFHEKFNLPHSGDGGGPPTNLDVDTFQFRLKFMQEELDEFALAVVCDDLYGAADALADLCYVALGTSHLMRLPFAAVWDEVQRANMTKIRASGADDPASVRKHSLDVVKPPGFTPPDHGPAIEAARARHQNGGAR